jgi:hypothetical protein
MKNRFLRAAPPLLAAVLAASATSCGGAGGGGNDPMVLVAFNWPNIYGVALDAPLIFTFSDPVDPYSVNPDTLQVNGELGYGFEFERIVVDGNLVAYLPRLPRFTDYSDGGLTKDKKYTVLLPIFPAPDTIRSTTGRPLQLAESFTFHTTPGVVFIEPRRPLVHAPGPITGPGLRGDEDGCVQNPTNSLFDGTFQVGTNDEAVLLCVKNEGPPQVLADISSPLHDTRALGTPSAAADGIGKIDLPAVRVRFNEPIDPATGASYVISSQLALNVQLWRVADTDLVELAVPEQIKTSQPTVAQDLTYTEVILVPSGPQRQGTYCVNVTQNVHDLPGNPLTITGDPNPASGGYDVVDGHLTGNIPPGFRWYFRTIELGATASSITENYAENFDERVTGLFTMTTGGTNPVDPIPTSPAAGGSAFTLVQTQPGQATNANWNGQLRFLGKSSLLVNPDVNDGSGTLKAAFEPFLGTGADGPLDVPGTATLASDGFTLPGSVDANGDGIWEFTSVNVHVGATLRVVGIRPIVILCRGTFVVDGTLDCSGQAGGAGIDTDGSAKYTSGGAMASGGLQGAGGPGGGIGGRGAPYGPGDGAGANGIWFDPPVTAGRGFVGASGDLAALQGGGGGGFGSNGTPGVNGANQGVTYGSANFNRLLSSFVIDRNFAPNAGILGGSGGGGGGADDDTNSTEPGGPSETANGLFPLSDDGGGGGGGGGGGIWVMANSIGVAGTVKANGGRGGNTYGPAQQVFANPDGIPSNGDEYVVGVVDETAAGTGQGAGGGGGSGGGILLQARVSLVVGGTVSAVGGAGGTSTTRNGGAGGDGRIALMAFGGNGEAAGASVSITGTVTPANGVTPATWFPTTDLTSQGVTLWFDQTSSNTQYTLPAVEDDNALTLQGMGLTRGLTNDFEILFEYQGAATLSPALDVQNATSGTGITTWSPTISSLNNLRYFRVRTRFFVAKADAVGANDPDFDQTIHPMPAVLSFTVPFTK